MGPTTVMRLAELRAEGMGRLDSLRALRDEFPDLELTIPDTEAELDRDQACEALGEVVSRDTDDATTWSPPERWHDLGAYEEAIPDADPEGLLELAAIILQRPVWQADALCQEPAYASLPWFPEKGQSTAECKEVCRRCLCAEECNDYAIEIGAKDGVWAGASPRTLKRSRAA